MELKLRVASGKSTGQEIAVAGPRFLVGRAADCHLRPKSDAVAEHHCVFEFEPAQVTVRDLNSTTGTFVGDVRIEGVVVLRQGDRIRIGPLEFEAVLSTGLASTKRPKVSSVGEAATRLASAPARELDVTQWLDEPESPAAPEPIVNEVEAPPVIVAPVQAKPAAVEQDATSRLAAEMLKRYQAKP